MRLLPTLTLLAFGVFSVAGVAVVGNEQPGQQVAAFADLVVPTDDGGTRQSATRFWLYLPADYSTTGENSWPLLLFLHGSGEKGDDLELVKKHGPPKLLQQEAQQKAWPFITVSPQCPRETRWNAAELVKLVEHVANTYRVDRRRIYVTGLSLGGSGAWSLLAEKPGLFAAAVPICGKGDPAAAEKIAKTPVWIFVGRKDRLEIVENCGQMEMALQSAGGDTKIAYYDDLDHDCWTVTYNNPEVWKWLLTHQLAEKP